MKFPGVSNYLSKGLKGVEEKQGKVMLAELVGEAFCRQLAIRNIETGKYPPNPGAEIDSFNHAVNELQKKYLGKIHDAILNWDFKAKK